MPKNLKYKHWCDDSGRVNLKIHITDALKDDAKFLVLNRPYVQRQLRELNYRDIVEYLQSQRLPNLDDKTPTEKMIMLVNIACFDIREGNHL
jgi:hypothetical protein